MIEEKKFEKMIRQTFDDILTQKKFDLLDSIYEENAIFYDAQDIIRGRAALKKLIVERSQAIPNFRYEIDDLVIKGNKATVRWHGTGKAEKGFADFKAGASANYWGISMFEANNKGILKNWAVSSTIDAPYHD